jgi:hypothetical protein
LTWQPEPPALQAAKMFSPHR